MKPLANNKDWQRERALLLHEAFTELEAAEAVGAATANKFFAALQARYKGKLLGKGKRAKLLKLSLGTCYHALQKWRANGRTPEAILLNYNAAPSKLPAAFVAEIHRRATLPGAFNHSRVWKSIEQDWRAGKELKGLGTWQDFWRTCSRTRDLPLPHQAPELTVVMARSTFYELQPERVIKAAGTKGTAAAKAHLPYVSLNYAKLRKCELYALDDVRLDLIVIDDATGRVIEVVCYVMIEAAARRIGGYVLKPANAIKAEDVDELLAHVLGTVGIGRDYATHIKFERGTIACSQAAQLVLEGATGGRLRVHRTDMIGGIRWVGSSAERKTGNAAGKAVIESFNRTLHLMLQHLPGQRGNRYENQPATLGFTGMVNKDGSARTHRGSLVGEAEKLAQFNLLASAAEATSVARCRLQLPMLYLSELHGIMREVIKQYNAEPGHAYQGHGAFAQIETAPGVWVRDPQQDVLNQTSFQS